MTNIRLQIFTQKLHMFYTLSITDITELTKLLQTCVHKQIIKNQKKFNINFFHVLRAILTIRIRVHDRTQYSFIVGIILQEVINSTSSNLFSKNTAYQLTDSLSIHFLKQLAFRSTSTYEEVCFSMLRSDLIVLFCKT